MSIAHALAKGWAQYRRRPFKHLEGGFVILPAGHPVINARKGEGKTFVGNDGSTLCTIHTHVLVSRREADFIGKWGDVNAIVRAALTAFFYEDSDD